MEAAVKARAFCLDDINAPHSGLVLALPRLPDLPIGRQSINCPNLVHPVSVGYQHLSPQITGKKGRQPLMGLE